MLNSVEHEILNTRKYKNTKKFSFFQTQISQKCYFPAQNVKMPTIVGILIFMSRKNFMLNSVEHEKSFITSGPDESCWGRCRDKILDRYETYKQVSFLY